MAAQGRGSGAQRKKAVSVITCHPVQGNASLAGFKLLCGIRSCRGTQRDRSPQEREALQHENVGTADGAALPREEAETGDREGNEGLEVG